jgi:hypothetical protein
MRRKDSFTQHRKYPKYHTSIDVNCTTTSIDTINSIFFDGCRTLFLSNKGFNQNPSITSEYCCETWIKFLKL